MSAYTIEEVELLRRKTGMTYREAVEALESHDGNLARTLMGLEKAGFLRESRNAAGEGGKPSVEKRGEVRQTAAGLLQKLYRCRVKVHKGSVPVINLSAVFAAAALLFAPHITVAGVIVSMILGYRFSFSQEDRDFTLGRQAPAAEPSAEAAAPAAAAPEQGVPEVSAVRADVPEISAPVISVPEADAPVLHTADAFSAEAPAAPSVELSLEDAPFMDLAALDVPTLQVPAQA